MIRPECTNCGDGQTSTINEGVVLGVLGGMALIALLVLIVVPVVRRRHGRRLGGRGDVESGFQLPSRRSSSRHQKMQQMQELKLPAGPDVLLPLIDPVSTITWSDLRSKNGSADSLEEVSYSFRTGDATTSHPDLGWGEHDRMADAGQDMLDAQTPLDAANVSPTPPGLPSKIGASTATARASYSSTPAASADALHAGMYPLSPVSPVLAMSRGASRSKPGSVRSGMDPVAEHASGSGSGGGDHPHLRQLPSPPSSPDQCEPNSRTSASRRRPSVTSSQTAPSALPYRPRSSTTTSVPLAAAFQTSLLSGTSSKHASTLPHAHHRYPSLAVQAPRSRASTVSLDPIPDHSPLERPSDASRRMSTAELRHRHPSSTGATQGSHPTTHATGSGSGHGSNAATLGSHAGDQPRAALQARHPEAQRVPALGEPGPSSYNHRHRSMQIERSPPPFTGSPSPLSPPPSARPFRPLPIPGAQTPSARPSTSASTSDPRSQHVPALVKKRDSPALRPLPASPFAHPASSAALGRQPSEASTRTRSSSVMSERSLPRQLPPLAPLPPLDFDSDVSPHGDARSIRSRGK